MPVLGNANGNDGLNTQNILSAVAGINAKLVLCSAWLSARLRFPRWCWLRALARFASSPAWHPLAGLGRLAAESKRCEQLQGSKRHTKSVALWKCRVVILSPLTNYMLRRLTACRTPARNSGPQPGRTWAAARGASTKLTAAQDGNAFLLEHFSPYSLTLLLRCAS